MGVVLWSASHSDQIAIDRQTATVARLLTDRIERIAHDQESVVIWDDAVLKTGPDFDVEWIDVNLGVWMHDYFGHDRSFLFDGNNRLVYAMADGASSPIEQHRFALGALAPVLAELRTEMASGGMAAYEAGLQSAPRVVALQFIDGHPAITSMMPIVSDSGRLLEPAGTERILASVRFLDGGFLSELATQFLLAEPRFVGTLSDALDVSSYPLVAPTGEILGYIVWSPERPGGALLAQTAPALAAAVVVFASVFLMLSIRLKRTYGELAEREAEARHLAFHDRMTGLPNRSMFIRRLTEDLDRSSSDGGPIAVLLLDIDRFKNVNDVFGHHAGDQVIIEVAKRLVAGQLGNETIARMGGDEFAIVSTARTSTEQLAKRCEKLVSSIGQPIPFSGGVAFVGVSIGVAVGIGPLDPIELIRRADVALYRCKAEGRNTFRFFTDEMSRDIGHRQRLEEDLRRALAAGTELELNYQPIYFSAGYALAGVEALARWRHPVLGNIPPSTFIPIAEESGLVRFIGDWVLREACKVLRDRDLPRVSINVSAVELRQPTYANRFLATVREFGVDPGRLEIEITEGVLVDNEGPSTLALEILRTSGVKLALDDFGTGYSSLRYIRRFAPHRLKIDRSFVADMDEHPEARAIVEAMVTLGHAMGMRVTAEGVETSNQKSFLRQIGCDELQGYVFSAPVTSEALDSIANPDWTTQGRAAG